MSNRAFFSYSRSDAADLRETKLPGGRLVGDGREGGRLKLIAGLLGVPLDNLVQRERKRQRLQLITRSAVAFTLALDETVTILNLDEGSVDWMVRPELENIHKVAFSPDGRLLAIAGRSGSSKFGRRKARDNSRSKRPRAFIHDLVWSPDGSRLVSGSDDGMIIVWGIASGRQLASYSRLWCSASAYLF